MTITNQRGLSKAGRSGFFMLDGVDGGEAWKRQVSGSRFSDSD